MSAKSKKPSKNFGQKTKAELEKPFAPKLWAKAKQLAAQYTVVIQPEPDLGYFGRTIEMPYVMADGKTPEACIAELMEATALAIAVDLENGERPPRPAGDEKRTAQVNLRLTQREKFDIEEAARREGFRGVSDFVRSAALEKAG